MGKLLKLISALRFLPLVLPAVMSVESALSGVPGPDKKTVVMAALDAARQVGETITDPDVQLVGTLIDSVVGVLNTTGVFQRSPVVQK